MPAAWRALCWDFTLSGDVAATVHVTELYVGLLSRSVFGVCTSRPKRRLGGSWVEGDGREWVEHHL